ERILSLRTDLPQGWKDVLYSLQYRQIRELQVLIQIHNWELVKTRLMPGVNHTEPRSTIRYTYPYNTTEQLMSDFIRAEVHRRLSGDARVSILLSKIESAMDSLPEDQREYWLEQIKGILEKGRTQSLLRMELLVDAILHHRWEEALDLTRNAEPPRAQQVYFDRKAAIRDALNRGDYVAAAEVLLTDIYPKLKLDFNSRDALIILLGSTKNVERNARNYAYLAALVETQDYTALNNFLNEFEIDKSKMPKDGSGTLGTGFAKVFARDGILERAINQMASFAVPSEGYVEIRGLSPEEEASFHRLPTFVKDKIYRLYLAMIREGLNEATALKIAININAAFIANSMTEDHRANLRWLEVHFVNEFARALGFSPESLVTETRSQIRFIAIIWSMDVGRLINEGYSPEEAMVIAYSSITQPDFAKKTTAFVGGTFVTSMIGKLTILNDIKNKTLSVAPASKILGLMSKFSVFAGVVFEHLAKTHSDLKSIEAHRLKTVPMNVRYVELDRLYGTIPGTMPLVNCWDEVNTTQPYIAETYETWAKLGVEVDARRSLISQIMELRYKKSKRDRYDPRENIRFKAYEAVELKLGLELSSGYDHLKMDYLQLVWSDIFIQTGILLASISAGAVVPIPGADLVVMMTVAASLSAAYDNWKYGIETWDEYQNELRKYQKLIDREGEYVNALNTWVEKIEAPMTGHWLEQNVAPITEDIEVLRFKWRQAIVMHQITVMSSYRRILGATTQYMRASASYGEEGLGPKHLTPLDIATQTVEALKAFGDGDLPFHDVDALDELFKRMYYSRKILTFLINVPWLNGNSVDAAQKNTMIPLTKLLIKDEMLRSVLPTNNRNRASAFVTRVPSKLAMQDQILDGLEMFLYREQVESLAQMLSNMNPVSSIMDFIEKMDLEKERDENYRARNAYKGILERMSPTEYRFTNLPQGDWSVEVTVRKKRERKTHQKDIAKFSVRANGGEGYAIIKQKMLETCSDPNYECWISAYRNGKLQKHLTQPVIKYIP
ncbi:MAG: hypothetical protein KDD48_08285, partial [Bdellovibrionales bacterium]|nr:hypothetical protein [Bdellovibrionales bacterium]